MAVEEVEGISNGHANLRGLLPPLRPPQQEGGPWEVLWSKDSRLVAVETQTRRHSSQPDIWLVSETTAHAVQVNLPVEKGSFHFNARGWVNKTDLEVFAIGIDEAAPDRENPVKTYRFTLRIDLKARTATIISKTKPSYGRF